MQHFSNLAVTAIPASQLVVQGLQSQSVTVIPQRVAITFPKLDPEPTSLIPQTEHIGDAPTTGQMYGRRNRGWEMVVPIAGNVEMQGELLLWRNPEEPMEAATKAYIDARPINVDGGTF